mgnify:CR=1 FL=1
MDTDKAVTLMDCFEEFRRPEILDDDNKWYCNKCKEHRDIHKKLELFRVPEILMIQIKRF